jgi:putative membrane protein
LQKFVFLLHKLNNRKVVCEIIPVESQGMKYLYSLLAVFCIVFTWSVINPKDYFTWVLEVFPAVIGLIILMTTFQKFRFTDFVYTLILIHCCILFVGGHYTYSEVPLFDWIKEVFHQSRNNYDKVGHLAQGLVPALITRELFLRKMVVNKRAWLNLIIVSICMAISVTYEFIEWFVSIATGASGDAFLGTQGDVWDTQSDMLFATIGAILGLLIFSKFHDMQIKKFSIK